MATLIEVLLVDDHRIVRQGLAALLASEPDIRVVAEAADGETAISLAEELRPAVVVMDLSLPGMSGCEAARVITSTGHSRVLMLSMHQELPYVSASLQAGASGYLLKDGAVDELVRAIRAVAQGSRYIGIEVAALMANDYAAILTGERTLDPEPELSPREIEVLTLLAQGRPSKQIAAKLGLSAKTVENHRSRIKHKLGLGSVAELTQYAIRRGLIQLDE